MVQTKYVPGVGFERGHAKTRAQMPHSYILILGPTGQVLTIGKQMQTSHVARVTHKRLRTLARLHVEHFDCFIFAPAYKLVGGEHFQATDAARVTSEFSHQAPARTIQIPHFNLTLIPTTNDYIFVG